MNITYIFGNGFDRQIGLLTSYHDFLQNYIRPSASDDEEITKFKSEIAIQEKSGLWSDAEVEFGKYVGSYSNDNVDKFIRLKQHFESELRDYLITQQKRCDYSNADGITSCFSDFILDSYLDVMNRRSDRIQSRNEDNVYNFITFNYTDVLYKIIECFPEKSVPIRFRNRFSDYIGEIVSVHGKLDSAPIFGVNDASQIDCSGGVAISDELRWNLIKPDLNKESGYRWDLKGKRIIDQSEILYIYGVSFGITDSIWWDYIRNWLNGTSRRKIVWFKRDKSDLDIHCAARELTAEKEYKIELMNKLRIDITESNNRFFDQFFIIHNTNRLNLKDILLSTSL